MTMVRNFGLISDKLNGNKIKITRFGCTATSVISTRTGAAAATPTTSTPLLTLMVATVLTTE